MSQVSHKQTHTHLYRNENRAPVLEEDSEAGFQSKGLKKFLGQNELFKDQCYL